MEKTAPPKLSKKLPEQLALPLAESVPPTGEEDTYPREVWTTLKSRSRASVKERWVRVMREAVSDACD